MTNQIATTQNSPAVTFNFFDPQQFEVMQRISKMFATSELVPDMYKVSEKNPIEKATANCMIAISLAQRMQADALMVMQNLVIIYGRPSWSSKFLIGTVNTCGRFETLKYRSKYLGKIGKINITTYVGFGRDKRAEVKEFDGSMMDNIELRAYTKAKGSDEELESSPVSILMAIQEGWYTKAGSKWVTMPEKMLKYRAASFWTNEYAPEISMGMKTDDEVADIIDTTYEDVTVSKVNDEIKSNANKTSLSMDPEPDQPGPITETDPKEADSAKSAIQPSAEFEKPANQSQPEQPTKTRLF